MSAAEVLVQHLWRGEILGCGCRWNWTEERTHFCGEEDRILRAHVQHQVDALKAAGHAIVELPKPNESGTWVLDDDFAVFRESLLRTSDDTIVSGVQIAWGSLELNLSQEDARALAATLLAVVGAIEAESHG